MVRGRQKTGENKICTVCSKEYYVSGWRLKKSPSRFCSVNCQNHKQYERAKFTCFLCKKRFEDSPCRTGKRKFCSLECFNYFQIDRKNCQKEKRRLGIATAREKGVYGNTAGSLRKFVFSKKQKECEVCKFNEFENCLDIHHADGNPNNNSIENLFVLCVMCHRKVHRGLILLNGVKFLEKRRRFPRKTNVIDIEKAKEIKILLEKKDMTHLEIGKLYEVNREVITAINTGKAWKDL